MEQRNDDYIEIDLLRLLRAVWRNITALALATLLCGGAGLVVASCVIPAEYQASALLYVNNSTVSVGSTSISLSDLSASQTLVKTYIAILNTRLTLNDVIEKAEVDYTFGQLKRMIKAQAVNGTEIFEITVTSKDPEEAERIANTVVRVLPDKIAQIVDGASVRVVDYAIVPQGKSGPSFTKFTLVGAAIGLLLSGAVVVVRELMDEQIHDEDYLHQTYGLPVLAAVPDLLAKPGKGYGSSYYAAAEKKGKK